MALTNKHQAVLVFISASLIGMGAYTVPATIASGSPWISAVLCFCGAIGFGIKEALG
jgi:hypothetical protein